MLRLKYFCFTLHESDPLPPPRIPHLPKRTSGTADAREVLGQNKFCDALHEIYMKMVFN